MWSAECEGDRAIRLPCFRRAVGRNTGSNVRSPHAISHGSSGKPRPLLLRHTISIQAEEGLQQQARAHNQTEAGRKILRERVVVEHRIARLVQLGIRRSRYFGKTKTRWQLVMAAVVANLSLVRGHSRRQAEAAGALPAEAAAASQNGLLIALLEAWSRLFARSEPAWT